VFAKGVEEKCMPLIHNHTFRVRHYECDPQGRVFAANYLRYMQEAAFAASAAAGYDVARYEAMGESWLIRETMVEYLDALGHGDAVEVRTWVVDFRRVRSRRAYEFRRTGRDALVARAFTDWVYLERETGRPTSIPAEMKAAFFPEGAPRIAPPRERFPVDSDPPPDAHRQRRPVEWRDLDAAGHVNNAVYIDFVEEVGRGLADGQAISTQRVHVEYRQPALPGDELEVVTWLAAREGRQKVRNTMIYRLGDSGLLARAQTEETWPNE
jgi:acyl-CoA thioester hydrolase